MPKALSLFFDVEDPFDEAADDATLQVAEAVAQRGVRATFCISGLKCSLLLDRDRKDVIGALKRHALGLHTYGHSFHPTTMELLADKGWDDGVDAWIREERRGVEAFRAAFDREPVCWGGAGNGWAPQVTQGLADLGVPAVVYSLLGAPGGRVHRFLGISGFPQTASLHEDDLRSEIPARVAVQRALAAVESAQSAWAGLFCGHPSRYLHTAFWDEPFFAGATPERYEGPELRRPDEFAACLENLGQIVEFFKRRFEVIGIDKALTMPWRWRRPEPEALAQVKKATEAAIRAAARWPVNRADLDPSGIVALTLERLDKFEMEA